MSYRGCIAEESEKERGENGSGKSGYKRVYAELQIAKFVKRSIEETDDVLQAINSLSDPTREFLSLARENGWLDSRLPPRKSLRNSTFIIRANTNVTKIFEYSILHRELFLRRSIAIQVCRSSLPLLLCNNNIREIN